MMRSFSKSGSTSMLTDKEKAFNRYCLTNKEVSYNLMRIEMAVVQMSYYGNRSSDVTLTTDSSEILDAIYTVLTNEGFKYSFNLPNKVLTISIF